MWRRIVPYTDGFSSGFHSLTATFVLKSIDSPQLPSLSTILAIIKFPNFSGQIMSWAPAIYIFSPFFAFVRLPPSSVLLFPILPSAPSGRTAFSWRSALMVHTVCHDTSLWCSFPMNWTCQCIFSPRSTAAEIQRRGFFHTQFLPVPVYLSAAGGSGCPNFLIIISLPWCHEPPRTSSESRWPAWGSSIIAMLFPFVP